MAEWDNEQPKRCKELYRLKRHDETRLCVRCSRPKDHDGNHVAAEDADNPGMALEWED